MHTMVCLLCFQGFPLPSCPQQDRLGDREVDQVRGVTILKAQCFSRIDCIWQILQCRQSLLHPSPRGRRETFSRRRGGNIVDLSPSSPSFIASTPTNSLRFSRDPL